MNKHKVGKILLLSLLCGAFEACDKFEAFLWNIRTARRMMRWRMY